MKVGSAAVMLFKTIESTTSSFNFMYVGIYGLYFTGSDIALQTSISNETYSNGYEN